MLKGEHDEDQHFALLMRSAQNGEAAAYSELLGRLTPPLRRLIRREQPRRRPPLCARQRQ